MPAWVEDAQQLTELKDLSSSQSSVLLRTTEVEEFLSNLNLSSHALVAPKGFGKTLVLKLKRISLQENDYRCFPFSPIVDRPPEQQAANIAERNHQRLGKQRQLGDPVEHRILDMPDKGISGRSRRSSTAHRLVGIG